MRSDGIASEALDEGNGRNRHAGLRRSWRSEFGAQTPRTLAARGAVPPRRSTMRSPPLKAELP
jgi:hypothetical protein